MKPELETYEDAFNPFERRLRRIYRALSWHLKRVLRKPPSILVETRWRLGDEIMALPIYEGLKRRYPRCPITAWCNHPALLLGNPFVDAVRPGNVDASGVRCDRYLRLSGAPRDVFRLEHYARCAGIPMPSANPRLYYDDWDVPLLEEARGSARQFIAVCTGASWPTKRWPIDRWRALSRDLEADGHRVVQVGKQDEVIGVGVSLVDRTSVRDSVCILHAARLLVCCDSGLMHLALAAGTPVVALFGPTAASILIRDGVPCQVLTNERPCQGCWNRSMRMTEPGVCPLDIVCCLEPIGVEAVFARVRDCLASEG